MSITIKGPGKGDLTGTSKKEKAARLASFSNKQNATVKTRIAQSENGFKGESKNEYGLPNGDQQVEAPRTASYTGPKSREVGQKMDKVGADKYADGSKGIKLKPKTSMDNDATKVGKRMTPKDIEDGANDRISKLSDSDLDKEATSNMSMIGKDNSRSNRAFGEQAKRKLNKEAGYSKYEAGSKGIKVKSK